MNGSIVLDPPISFIALAVLGLAVISIGIGLLLLWQQWRADDRERRRTRAEIKDLRQAIEAQRETNHALTDQLEVKDHEANALRLQISAIQMELSRAQAAQESSNQRAANLEETIRQLERQSGESQRTLTTHQAMIADLNDQLDQARLEAAQVVILKAQVEDERARIGKLNGDLYQANLKIQETTGLRAMLEEEKANNTELTSRLTQFNLLNEQLIAHEAMLNEERAKSAELIHQLGRAQLQNEQMNALHAQLEADLNAQLDQSKQQLNLITTLEEQIEKDKETIDEWTNRLNAAEERFAELRAQQAEMIKYRRTIAVLAPQAVLINQQTEQINAFENRIKAEGVSTRVLKRQLAHEKRTAAQAIRLRERVAKNKTAIAELRNKWKLAKQERQALAQESRKKDSLLAKQTKVLDELNRKSAENLQRIKGIGPAYARRLRAGGIITLNDLAKASVVRLQEIIQPRKWQRPDFARWIRQAKQAKRVGVGSGGKAKARG